MCVSGYVGFILSSNNINKPPPYTIPVTLRVRDLNLSESAGNTSLYSRMAIEGLPTEQDPFVDWRELDGGVWGIEVRARNLTPSFGIFFPASLRSQSGVSNSRNQPRMSEGAHRRPIPSTTGRQAVWWVPRVRVQDHSRQCTPGSRHHIALARPDTSRRVVRILACTLFTWYVGTPTNLKSPQTVQ